MLAMRAFSKLLKGGLFVFFQIHSLILVQLFKRTCDIQKHKSYFISLFGTDKLYPQIIDN